MNHISNQFMERQNKSFCMSSLALNPSPFSFKFHYSSIFTIEPSIILLYRFYCPSGKSSSSMWFMDGKLETQNFYYFPIQFNEPKFCTLFVISFKDWPKSGLLIFFSDLSQDFRVGSVLSSINLYLMSQFFWMYEQNRFFILFYGLPGRCLLIYDHFLPSSEQSSIIFLSYSSVQSSFLILGSNLLMNLYRICLPVFVPSISDSSFQFLPIFFINFLTAQSSSADQILR